MTDETTPQDDAAMPPASDGSVPVAWAVVWPGDGMEIDCEWVYPDEATAGDVALSGTGIDGRRGAGTVVPLYRSPTLTDEEREAVERAADWLDRWQQTHGYHSSESGDLATLRGLLKRTG